MSVSLGLDRPYVIGTEVTSRKYSATLKVDWLGYAGMAVMCPHLRPAWKS